jgi:putative toxin-antitoxin system antitoxin component (TIGR02293 family)
MPSLQLQLLVDEPGQSKRAEQAIHEAMPKVAVHAISLRDLMRLMFKAYDVFEDTAKAERWFRKPNRALGKRTPLDVALNDSQGAATVEQILGRIEHGVFS